LTDSSNRRSPLPSEGSTTTRRSSDQQIRRASSLILFKATSPPQVLLLKRSEKARWMPNVFVFPGGGVDPQLDHRPGGDSPDRGADEALSHLDWRAWGFSTFGEALASLRAALRETHEEAGLKLAPGALGALNCVAHWLTPPALAKRYDTYFWAASWEPTQEVAIDGHEISDFGWWSPSVALDAYARGEIDLAPPTFCLLTEMARYQDSAQYILSASSSPPPEAICPHLIRGAQISLCLPGDDAHPKSTHQAGRRHRLTRLDGRWTWDISTNKPLCSH